MEHARWVQQILKDHPDIANIEEMTKGSLIDPLLRCLGYDPKDPGQVKREAGIRNKRVDYMLIGEKGAKIAVEAKSAKTILSQKVIDQLDGYFHHSDAVAGVLTNGIEYWLFTDLKKTNVMDSEPYHRVNIKNPDDITDNDIRHLNTLAKSNVQQSTVRQRAHREKNRKLVNEIIEKELRSPSQEFLRLVGKKAGIKPLTKHQLTLLAPLVGEAIGRILGRKPPPPPSPPSPPPPPAPSSPPPLPPPTSPTALASLFGNPLSAKTYRQVLIDIVIEMQRQHRYTFAETVSKEPFVKPSSSWKWISSNREDLSPALASKQVGEYFLDVNLSARGSVSRARSFLKAFGHSPADLVVHKSPGPAKIKGAELFGKPIPAKNYIEMLTSVVSVLQARHPNDFADRVRDPKVFRGTKRWIISKNRDDLGTAKSKKVGDYWIDAGGTGRVPRAHKFLKAFGYSPDELEIHTSD